MAAVTEIEKLIKESQKGLESLLDEKKKILEDEEHEQKEEATALAEQEAKRRKEKERLAEEKKIEDEALRVSGLRRALEESKEKICIARTESERQFHEQLSQAKNDEKRRFGQELEGQVSDAATNFDNDISKAKKDLDKAKVVIQKADSKVASAESEYKTLLKSEGTGEMSEETSKEALSTTSKLVQAVTASNKRNAAEAHTFSFSLVSNHSEVKSETELDLQTTADPKYYRTHEEWSTIAKQASSLNDALYSEPSESPYFAQSEKQHAIIGPSVKEYVRDRQMRLLDHWTELAEEYEVRKRLYERQQKKLAKKGQQRGSISVAGRKSILGDKDAGERAGLDRGGNILESTGRSSNNPYRRARRGNEVRSEYEQEQIIAEIAAKEAMEKRITHGGSKVPRQVCRLERVS